MEERIEQEIDYLLDKIMDELAYVLIFTPLYIPRKSIGYVEETDMFYFSIKKNRNSLRQDFSVSNKDFDNDMIKIKQSIEETFNIKIKKYIV